MRIISILAFLATAFILNAQDAAPAPFGAIPSPQQLAWHDMEYYAFVHFNMNTFTGKEWGEGNEDPNLFNPSELDCRQWAKTFKKAGMKAVIITAKHHDGFCLWNSKYSVHSIAKSNWQNGKGDILRDLSAACKAEGLKFGIYISPWDRNHPAYGTPAYNEIFAKMLEEVLTQYGDIAEVWFDGANGEGPNGKKQTYDWDLFNRTVYKYQPYSIIFSDGGPGCRWVGNENGIAGETNWCTLDGEKVYPGYPNYKELTTGHEDAANWIPAESDVSIRPGWYYRESEDKRVKDEEELFDIYIKSVGRNANLLLNVPADKRGLINKKDIKSLICFKKKRDKVFKNDLAKKCDITASTYRASNPKYSPQNLIDKKSDNYWATNDNTTTGWVTLDFGKEKKCNYLVIEEFIALGQRVQKFKVEYKNGEDWKLITEGTTIGHKRILKLNEGIKTTQLRVSILKSKACPVLRSIAVF